MRIWRSDSGPCRRMAMSPNDGHRDRQGLCRQSAALETLESEAAGVRTYRHNPVGIVRR